MSSTTKLCLSITLLALLSLTSTNSQSQPSVYDVLGTFDFPPGLLPQGVTGYEYNEETGAFKVYLPKTCKFHIESYELEYKSTISGKITRDKLSNLSGVKVKVLLLWLSITEVRKNDDELEFSVGIASANFPLDGFEESPQCGCGFDCVNEREWSTAGDHVEEGGSGIERLAFSS